MKGKTLSWGENLKSQSVEQVCSWISAYLQFPAFPPLAPPLVSTPSQPQCRRKQQSSKDHQAQRPGSERKPGSETKCESGLLLHTLVLALKRVGADTLVRPVWLHIQFQGSLSYTVSDNIRTYGFIQQNQKERNEWQESSRQEGQRSMTLFLCFRGGLTLGKKSPRISTQIAFLLASYNHSS